MHPHTPEAVGDELGATLHPHTHSHTRDCVQHRANVQWINTSDAQTVAPGSPPAAPNGKTAGAANVLMARQEGEVGGGDEHTCQKRVDRGLAVSVSHQVNKNESILQTHRTYGRADNAMASAATHREPCVVVCKQGTQQPWPQSTHNTHKPSLSLC